MRQLFAAVIFLFGVASAHAVEAVNIPLFEQPKDVKQFVFTDADGNEKTLADYKGKVVLLNVWATWCSPCRREMPLLDNLQAKLGSDKFEVLALSVDRGGKPKVDAFFEEFGIKSLPVLTDPSNNVAKSFFMFGLPATFFIDAEGRQIGSYIGEAEWDSPEFIAFFQNIIDAQG